jgi:hypothetical protein
MAPDFPYYLPRRLGIPRELTHSVPGLLTVDLAMTLVAVAVWWFLLREPVIDLLPAPLRERIPPRPAMAWRRGHRSSAVAVVLVVVSALVGGAMHLIWDSFTHPGWIVDHVGFLHQQAGPLLVDKWLQHASTVGGIVALGVWAGLRLRRTPRDPARPVRFTPGQRAVGLVVVLLAAGVPSGGWWIHGMLAGAGPLDPVLLFPVACLLVACAAVAVILAAGAWHLLRRRA